MEALIAVAAVLNAVIYASFSVVAWRQGRRGELGEHYRHVVLSSAAIAATYLCITLRHIWLAGTGFGPAEWVSWPFLVVMVVSAYAGVVRAREFLDR